MAIPNIEVFTALLFFAGYYLGLRLGLLSAAAASFLYFGLNPQGGLFPPLFLAQLTGSFAAPVAGEVLREFEWEGWPQRFFLAGSALVVTLWYDLLTNLAFPLAAGFNLRATMATMAAGVPFSLIHIGGNMVVFVVLLPHVMAGARRIQPAA